MAPRTSSCVVLAAGIGLLTGLAGAVEVSPPTLNDVRNSTVTGLFDQPVSLVDGRWEGEPYAPDGASRPSAGVAGDLLLTGDLTGDGFAETVAFLWSATGGSGTRNYIAVFGWDGNVAANLATSLIGDRAQVRGGRVLNGHIEVDVVQHAPDDAQCCPTMNVIRTWSYEGDRFVEGPAAVGAPLSAKDLEEEEWGLADSRPGHDHGTSGTATLVVEDGRISGRTPCGRYTATVSDGREPGEIRIGQVASTSTACIDDKAKSDEQDFLAVLAGVNRFGFISGDLVLTALVDGRQKTLRFEPLSNQNN